MPPSAEDLARAALQWFFGTKEFRHMTNAQRRRAVRCVQALLDASTVVQPAP